MHKAMLSILLLGLSLFAGAAVSSEPATEAVDAVAESAPTAGPLDKRLRALSALRNNDAAALIEVMDPLNGLSQFLTEGSEETSETIAAKMAQEPKSQGDREFLRIWRALASADGVAAVSAEWYPKWQAQVPQVLAGVQMAVAGIGAAVAENTSMSALERSQMIELRWALTGWLSRTDLADRKAFEQMLGIAHAWILSSGTLHPQQLQLLGPERRLELADDAVKSAKRVLGLYGLDADGVLASVQMEEVSRAGEHARVRTSLKLLGVPLAFEEDLTWFEGNWQDTETVAMLKAERARPEPEVDEFFDDPTADDDATESASKTSCSAPAGT